MIFVGPFQLKLFNDSMISLPQIEALPLKSIILPSFPTLQSHLSLWHAVFFAAVYHRTR